MTKAVGIDLTPAHSRHLLLSTLGPAMGRRKVGLTMAVSDPPDAVSAPVSSLFPAGSPWRSVHVPELCSPEGTDCQQLSISEPCVTAALLRAGTCSTTSQQSRGTRGETGKQSEDLLSNYLPASPASPPTPFCNLVINLITAPAPEAGPAGEQELCQEGLAPRGLAGLGPSTWTHP